MKTSLDAKNKSLDPSALKALVGLNLLATPGLGTLIAGRFLAGITQLALACAGFALVMWWFFYLFKALMAGVTYVGHAWLWQLGAILLVISWLGALWSSVGMWRNKAEAGKAPPKLNG